MARGMAAISFDVQLLGSAYEGDELEVATWIVDPDGRVRLARQFQIRHRNLPDAGTRLFQIRLYQPRYGQGGTHAANLQRDLCYGQRAGGFRVRQTLLLFRGLRCLESRSKAG